MANRAVARALEKRNAELEPTWRPFQLALLLLNLPGIVDPASADRDTVDLLFFPTGGGKTEAYLGLAAFAMVLRRLSIPGDAGRGGAGVSVTMRYTLRLLTLDQLGRAAGLVCALELQREEDPERSVDWPVDIGLWVGSAATANEMGCKGWWSRCSGGATRRSFRPSDRFAVGRAAQCPGAVGRCLRIRPLGRLPTARRGALGVGHCGPCGTGARVLAEFQSLSVGGRAAAAWLRSLNSVQANAQKADLIWSGPQVEGLHARDTLGTAWRSLWLSTHVIFDGPRVFEALARRMDAEPGLTVTLLLNIQRQRGDPTAADHVVRRFADRLWGIEWPGAARPRVFYDPRALEPDRPGGVLHAKAVVADEESVYITSANLTAAALERNIELGLLVRDPALAGSVIVHFRGLIDQSLLRVLPAA